MSSPQKSKEPTVDSTGSHDSGDNNNSPQPEDQQARKVDGSIDSTGEPKHGESSTGTPSESKEDDAVAKARARQERFKALQARAVSGFLLFLSVYRIGKSWTLFGPIQTDTCGRKMPANAI